MRRFLKGFLILAVLFGVSAQGGVLTEAQKKYLTISDVEIVEVASEPVLETYDFPNPRDLELPRGSGVPELDEAELILDQIIRMGTKVWKIVEAGRPVVNVSSQMAHALPVGAQHWLQFAGWRAPEVRSYKIAYKNAYGMEVVKFTWRIQYTPGGSFGGQGQYLANISVVPSDVYVAWGFTFNADAGMNSVTNAGTANDPVAAAELFVRWKVSSVMTHAERTLNYYVRGDGYFRDMNEAQ